MRKVVEKVVKLLEEVINDRTVPRNIREAVRRAKECLMEEGKDLAVRADEAIQILEEVSSDLNLPIYTRTQIWNAISMLEEAQNI
ncbi:hypothetical protein DRN62_00745 [Nanoarchaeota archaeon]|nr:UPF0147 family protein [Nanoarchaeota archaeon]RLG17619.1 MAG: hypothetical protein DRN62_00745 [Nanoarchaeota archaeon]HDD04913.1 hypothetical protein [Candidatus Aenigmarchaeota archaeon]